MKASFEKPPIWKQANELFKLDQLGLGAIFTFGDTIYNPFHIEVTDDLEAHEAVHEIQQREFPGGPKAWWDKFCEDPAFRIDQEAKAYRAQYLFLRKKKARSLNEQHNIAHMLAGLLAGPMYGNVITSPDAMRRIYGMHDKPETPMREKVERTTPTNKTLKNIAAHERRMAERKRKNEKFNAKKGATITAA